MALPPEAANAAPSSSVSASPAFPRLDSTDGVRYNGSSTSHPFATLLADNTDTDTVNDVETIADKQQGIVYQYYFLILVLGVLIFIGTLLVMRRRRNRRKANAANLGRHALARDLESWQPSQGHQQRANPPTTARRWMQRYNRFGNRHPNRITEEDESGLNEFGEAPPPYVAGKTKTDVHRRDSHSDAANANLPAVPLRTLSRNATGKPPGYEQSLAPIESTTSLIVEEVNTRPATQQTDSSTTNLLTHPQTPLPASQVETSSSTAANSQTTRTHNE